MTFTERLNFIYVCAHSCSGLKVCKVSKNAIMLASQVT